MYRHTQSDMTFIVMNNNGSLTGFDFPEGQKSTVLFSGTFECVAKYKVSLRKQCISERVA